MSETITPLTVSQQVAAANSAPESAETTAPIATTTPETKPVSAVVEAEDAEETEEALKAKFPDYESLLEAHKKLKLEGRRWENRSKTNLSAKEQAEKDAAELKAQQETLKTAEQKTADRLAEVEAEAKAARTELARFKVATLKGIPAHALPLLTGSTEEEVNASAELILSLLGAQAQKGTMQPVKTQGTTATARGPVSVLDEIREANS